MGEAVEVGTHRGDFAYQIMKHWKGQKLYCVDPWDNPPGYEDQAKFLPGGGVDREDDLRIAKRRLHTWRDRVMFVPATSMDAIEDFRNDYLDFVYIDGDHREQQVWQDVCHWWMKIKSGGILAGHDFISRTQYSAYLDVQRAVMEFAERWDLDVYIVPEIKAEPEFQPWSFYLIKP